MLCQQCHKNVANVCITQIVNNNKVQIYLCESCANEKDQFSFGPMLSINGFFPGFIGYTNTSPYMEHAVQDVVCDKCKMSFEEFQKTGKLGCANCYTAFGDRMKSLLKRVHGNVQHTGKIPGRVSQSVKVSKEIGRLKEELNKAIQNEEYEKAAELRDKIRSLEVES